MNMAIRRTPLYHSGPMVNLSGLTKNYGDFRAVDELSLTIFKNETVALLGPSGCGKTTTLRLVAGLEVPDRGEIMLAGDLMSSPTKLVAPYIRGVGMVFQDLALWPHMTVAKHIDFALSRSLRKYDRKKAVAEILARVRLEKPDRYPRELSGGERQRLALGRALAAEPNILLLDEPFSNLDPALKKELLTELSLLTARRGITTLYITHQWEEAFALADRIAVMEQGKIVRVGRTEEFVQERENAAIVSKPDQQSLLFP